MARSMSVVDASIDVYHQNTPDSDTPDTVIDGDLINGASISSRADSTNDEVSFDIDDYPNADYDLRMGDRITFSATIAAGGAGYGESWGRNWGGGQTISWTGRVLTTDRSRDHEGPLGSILSAEATDYVAGILKERRVTGSWVDEDVGQIIRDICEQKASEIDASNVPNLGVKTDLFVQNSDCWDTIVSLASRADALITQDGIELRIKPIADLPYRFDLVDTDYYYPWETSTDDDVKNVIRVDSGVTREQEQAQETQSSWERVTQSSRKTFRLRSRKSAIHSIDIYLRSASDEDLKLRLQADEGGAPVNIGNENSDIDSAQWSSDNLPDEGWKSFFFNEHTLPDRDPWVIIETSGDTGHDIGVDSNGNTTHRSYYPHPLNVEVSSPESIAEYGSREIRIERDNLETLVAARDAAQAELARRAWPTKDITFSAASPRAHSLNPGEIINVDEPEEDAVGDFIVTEVSHDFSAGNPQLQTDISATWRKGVLAP